MVLSWVSTIEIRFLCLLFDSNINLLHLNFTFRNFLQVLCRYQPKWNLDLQLRPFYLSGIMAGTGTDSIV